MTNSKPNQKLLTFCVVCVGICVVAAFASLLLGNTLRKAMASRSWPATEARVEEVGEKNSAGDGYSVTALKYSYEFGGVRYFGSRISYRLILSGLPDLRKIEPGRMLTAFVNPDLPDESVLVPGPNAFNWVLLAITMALVVVPLGVMLAVIYSNDLRQTIRDGWVKTELF